VKLRMEKGFKYSKMEIGQCNKKSGD